MRLSGNYIFIEDWKIKLGVGLWGDEMEGTDSQKR